MQHLFNLFYESTGVSTDTRKIKQGNLFIALSGTNFNGNTYAKQAIEKGAQFAIVDEHEYANGEKIFYVENGLKFLQNLAKYHREKFSIPVIGITGSNGKTTTKELIAAVLQKKFKILATQGNLNNHIGVPLTLLQLSNEHDLAVIEMGASKLGDIEEITAIVNPSHGIITNIGNAHLEGFGGIQGVIKTKKELYDSIEQIGGTIFVNADDDTLLSVLPEAVEIITYGQQSTFNVQGKLNKYIPEVVFSWNADKANGNEIKTHIIGKYNFYNMLAAVTIGNYFEVNAQQINKALSNYIPDNNRSQIEKTKYNTLILDAYNANPTSMKSALESFKEMPSEEKFFILGDMKELGKNSLDFHREIIELTKHLQLQGIFIGEEFLKTIKLDDSIKAFGSTREARNFLIAAKPANNLILLKGSRSIGLEKLKDVF